MKTIITKPDKARGIVQLNWDEYNMKINEILNYMIKFRLLKTNIVTHILKLDDKPNRFLHSIKDSNGESVCNNLFAFESRPGVLYGH